MRLNELEQVDKKFLNSFYRTGISPTRIKRPDDYTKRLDVPRANIDQILEKWLRNRGFKRLGSGYYSSVWSQPNSPYLIKINDKIDNAYESYLMMAKKLSFKNPLFPRIMNTWHAGPLFCVAMETLSKFQQQTASVELKTQFLFIRNYFASILEFKAVQDPVEYFKNIEENLLQRISRNGGFIGVFTLNDDYRKLTDREDVTKYVQSAFGAVPKLLSEPYNGWLFEMGHVISRCKGELDLHGGNVMVRDAGKSTEMLVITDPVAS